MDHSTCMKDLEQGQKVVVVHEGHESGRFSFFVISFLELRQECSTTFRMSELWMNTYTFKNNSLVMLLWYLIIYVPTVTRLRGLIVYPNRDLALRTPYVRPTTVQQHNTVELPRSIWHCDLIAFGGAAYPSFVCFDVKPEYQPPKRQSSYLPNTIHHGFHRLRHPCIRLSRRSLHFPQPSF